MLRYPIEPAAASLRGKPPEELPHGLITPPEFVRQLVAEQKAKFPPGIYTAATEERELSEHTLQWFFDQLGHEVLYRQTPEGPEVLAVGFDEIFALTDFRSSEKMNGLKTWVP
jgi:hypothetical protein